MYKDFLSERLAQLRLQKNVSARDMSLSLGQNESYINRIENKKTMPSMENFFFICDYFNITPEQFFSRENENPLIINQIYEDLKPLSQQQLLAVSSLIKDIKKL